MKKFVIVIGVVVFFVFFQWLSYMVFPPTMIWQEFGRMPVADLGSAGENILPEKESTVYAYRVTLRDVRGEFSPGEYIKKHGGDVAINNLVFTQDKERVRKFMEEKGVKLLIEKAPYHPKALARR